MATANPPVIVFGALVIGLGYGVVTPASSSILADRSPKHLRALIFSLKQTGVPVGGALAGALLPLLSSLWGWRWAALGASLGCVVVALAIEPLRPAMESERVRNPAATPSRWAGLVILFRDRRLRELSLAAFMFAGMQNCLASYLVIYLHERIGISLSLAGFALSAAMAAGIGGRIFWGIVADRWKSRPLLGWIGVGMAAASVAVAFIAPHWPAAAIIGAAVVFGLTAVGWNGVFLAEVAHIVPVEQAGAATGASLAMTYAGVVTLPLLFLAIVRATDSYAAAYCVVAVVTLWRSLVLFRDAR
jgi:predicted MFS family arabinose efflux permease